MFYAACAEHNATVLKRTDWMQMIDVFFLFFFIVKLEIQAAALYSLDCLCFPPIEIKIFQVERLYSFTAQSIQILQTTRKISTRLVEMLIILLLLLLNLKVWPRNQKRIGLVEYWGSYFIRNFSGIPLSPHWKSTSRYWQSHVCIVKCKDCRLALLSPKALANRL